MLLTWTVVRTTERTAASWTPTDARWWHAGVSTPGRTQGAAPAGRWSSVVATWHDRAAAETGPPSRAGVDTWHVVLQPRSAHGDLVLADGARPFDRLRPGPPPEGTAALVTLAGTSPDAGREREFSRRFGHVARDLARAPGHLVSLVHAPEGAPQVGPVLTFSAWRDLAAGVDWAYTTSSPHASAVARQRDHRLVDLSGSVRCAVLSSRGVLGDQGDPLGADGVRSPAGGTGLGPP